ncbi:MAG: matrixin family metalloprotease [Planctomycetota bacterium]|nr:matrixin family metalloprotease [Planctomycetota bacterium]
MRLSPLLLPTATVFAGGWFLLPSAQAWVELGFFLSTEHRDFRVWNNFGDPEANDHTVEHPNFPGYTGATVAIWKGAVEWGSRLHGDGEGDPSQPAGLGSGGANFDPSFQGLAQVAGSVGDNIHSELQGCSGGTHAFTEFFLDGSGSRTFYYSCWKWEDDPDPSWPNQTGKLDLQGIATHEFGHALGLGHSDDPGATMYATTENGKSHRDIAGDDVAGIKAIYGTAAPFKPRIDEVSIDRNSLTIHGANFAPLDNEVWFTRGTGAGDGSPIVAFGDSPSGETLIVTVPALAGPGDVLVRLGPGGGERLSNAFPFDARLECDPITITCPTTPNSVGSGARVILTGGQSVSANTTVLNAIGSPPGQFGLFFFGDDTDVVPLGNGTLCIAAPLIRLAPLPIDAMGRASFPLDLTSLPQGAAIEAGDTVHFQWWYRDPNGGGAMSDLSDAIAVPFCE